MHGIRSVFSELSKFSKPVVFGILTFALYKTAGLGFGTISFGMITYHVLFRVLVGEIVNGLFHNDIDYTKPFFVVRERERGFYRAIGVKKWKHRIPTYDENAFNPSLRSWEEIAKATCQSELVHEIDGFFCLISVCAGFFFGAWLIFALAAAATFVCELVPVFLQRFNRDRIVQMLDEQKSSVG